MTSHPAGDRFGLLDTSLDGSIDERREQVLASEGRRSQNWRRLLGWSATSAPVALLLLAGIAVGPRGINLLSPAALSFLDPVVPVALAALGVLVGVGVGDRRSDDRRVLAAACLDAAVTMLVVSAGIAALAFTAVPSSYRPFWTLVLTGGICAATSLTLPTGNPLEPRTAATRVRELGVLLPIVSGGLLLAWLNAGSSGGAVVLMAQASLVTLALAAAGWLLLSGASSETEERVFSVSVLLLIGGVADSLSLSALFGGLIAGVFWRYAGRRPRDTISRDVLFVQHPLVVLVLLVAGARVDLSLASLGLGAGYLLLRVAGKLAGGLMAARLVGVRAHRNLDLTLLPPGVFGVAFALNAVRLGADDALVLAAVVIGTIGSDVIALLLPSRSVSE
ncbi:MAG TPA: hypothetical protein VI485_13845 [Vicinamibacterales bacterium]|nr:hypothetical protein [Vicinamibacterales bacterium]